jgi:potassium channel subfamily K
MALLNFTQSLLDDWRNRVALVPLLAAIIAPLSSLLDIPALTEPWFVQNGDKLSDPRVNLVLSAVSLFVNFVANALLVLRFSVGNDWWKWAIRSSLVCWIVKVSSLIVL